MKSRRAPAQDVPLMITGLPRAAQRLHQGVPQLAYVLAHGGQLGETRNPPAAVKGMGKLVDVRSDLAQMPQEAGQLLALDRRAAHRPGTGAAERQGAQIGPDAEAGLRCRAVDRRAFFCGAPNGDKGGLRVADASAAPPRGHGLGTRVRSLAHRRTPPLRLPSAYVSSDGSRPTRGCNGGYAPLPSVMGNGCQRHFPCNITCLVSPPNR